MSTATQNVSAAAAQMQRAVDKEAWLRRAIANEPKASTIAILQGELRATVADVNTAKQALSKASKASSY